MPGAPSRGSGTRSLDWVPLRCELVVEGSYENLTGMRFRHPARFVRWRPDKEPADCRYSQLEHPPPVEYTEIFSERSR
jgi:ATP-dependent DNA ligase